MGTLLTPAQIWKNFDPVAESLDATLLKSEQSGNIKIEYYYFTGRHLDNEASRVYCVVASSGENLPALIVVGKVSEPIDVNNLVYWASQGYTAIAIDYAGDMGEGKHTVYPESVSYCNYLLAGRHFDRVDTDVTETSWYEYSLNTMRAVTFLNEYICPDKNNICLYSVGKSARIASHCLAFDSRIRTACIAYGKIWEDYKNPDKESEDVSPDENLEILEEEERWLAGICPQSYIHLIEQPVYVLVGSNSKYTDMSDTAAAIQRFPNKNSRYFFVAGMLDTLTTEVKRSMDKWFKNSLDIAKPPKQPKLSVFAENGKLYAKIETEAKFFTVWYARGPKENRLNWVAPVMTKTEYGANAELNIYDEELPVSVYANADFYNGMKLSSEIHVFTPKDISKNLTLIDYTRMIYNQSMGMGEFIPIDVTGEETLWDKSSIVFATGPLGIGGISGKRFGTFALSENMILRHFESVLIFDVCSETKQNLDVCIVQNWNKDQCRYFCRFSLLGGNMWQKIVLSGQDFRCTTGKTLVADKVGGLDLLAFACENNIIVTNILFT